MCYSYTHYNTLVSLRLQWDTFGVVGGFPMTQTLLSVEQAAERLGGVSRWSIYSWLSQGRLRKTKVGSRVMIRESDLQAFIDQCNPAEPNGDCNIPARPQ
jgi:excisionase family DNA binding protein